MRNPSKQLAFHHERNATCDASKSSTSNQTKKKSPAFEWQFVKALYGGYVHWECNYCHAIKSGGAPRIRDHFLGSSSRSMRRCQSANVEVVAMRIKEHYQCKNRNASMVINQHESGMPNALDEEVGVHSKSSSFAAPDASTSTKNVGEGASSKSASFPTVNRSRQTSLDESFRSTLLEDAQLALAKAIYFSGSAMSMVDNMHWRSAWNKIGELGAGFTAPSYHTMRHGMLDKCT